MASSEVNHGQACIMLVGELDIAAAAEAFSALVAVPARVVVADLGQLTFIDAAGLRALMHAKAIVEQTGHRMVVRGAGPPVRRVFELCDLSYVLDER